MTYAYLRGNPKGPKTDNTTGDTIFEALIGFATLLGTRGHEFKFPYGISFLYSFLVVILCSELLTNSGNELHTYEEIISWQNQQVE